MRVHLQQNPEKRERRNHRQFLDKGHNRGCEGNLSTPLGSEQQDKEEHDIPRPVIQDSVLVPVERREGTAQGEKGRRGIQGQPDGYRRQHSHTGIPCRRGTEACRRAGFGCRQHRQQCDDGFHRALLGIFRLHQGLQRRDFRERHGRQRILQQQFLPRPDHKQRFAQGDEVRQQGVPASAAHGRAKALYRNWMSV